MVLLKSNEEFIFIKKRRIIFEILKYIIHLYNINEEGFD